MVKATKINGRDSYVVQINYKPKKPNDTMLSVIRIFDANEGLNVTSHIVEGEKFRKQEQLCKYIKMDNIWVPSETQYTSYNSKGEVRYSRIMKLKSGIVNKQISDETFKISHLNLNDGDVLDDQIVKKQFTYLKGALKPMEKADGSQSLGASKNGQWRGLLIIVINAVILTIIGACIASQRWKGEDRQQAKKDKEK